VRGAIIHGVLLLVMLVYGYRTWTRDKTVQPNVGSVVLWDKAEGDIKSIEYKSEKKITKLENRGDYWWGTDTTIELRPKKKDEPANAGSGAGSGSAGSAAGSGAGSGSAAKKPEPVEMEEAGRKVHEFPLGDAGDKLVKNFAAARALRDLGAPNDATKKDYKLDDAKTTVTVTFKDGSTREFLVGGSVYGGSDKYALDQKNNKAFVFSRDMLSGLETGEASLHLTDPRGFDAAKIASVTIKAGDKSRTAVRVTTKGQGEGQEVKTWGEPDTKKANQTVANFIDNATNLRPVEYASNLKVSDMKPVLKLTYKEERGATLGTLTLYKYEKPGELPPGATLDPANPPKPTTEYYIMTEKTHIPGLVRPDSAQRMENDIDTVFSGKQPEGSGAGVGSAHSAVSPHGGNPFGKGPLPKIGAGSGGVAPMPPVPVSPTAGSGSPKIAPTAAGSAAH